MELTNKKRLTSEEFDDLIEKYISLRNESNNLSKKKSDLFLFEKEMMIHVNRLIDSYSYKYKRFSNYEDLKQEALESFLKSILTFDKSKGKFVGWIKAYSETKIKRQAKNHSAISISLKEAKKTPPMKISIEDYEKENGEIKEFRVNPEQAVIKNDLWKKIKKSFDKLSEKESKIIKYHFKVDDEFTNIGHLCSSLSLSPLDYKVHLKNATKKVETDLNLKKSELSKLI